MTDKIVNFSTQIFPYAFFDCQTLFIFDNIANYTCSIKNTILAKKMNQGVSEKRS